MSAHDLTAAGIVDPTLRSAYEQCRRLNARHGRTYYLATQLLPSAKRPYVHALYALARYSDEIVDDIGSTTPSDREARLRAWHVRFRSDLDAGTSTHPVLRAAIDTTLRWQIPAEHFESFFTAMSMDVSVTDYATYEDLCAYMRGSAAAIGLQVTHVLEPTSERALTYAIDLGFAFQLVNFVRDVGEDLDRGRVYLPADELARFDVDREVLARRVPTEPVRQALEFQLARVRDLARRSQAGVGLLAPTSRPCVDAARTLYCGIADEIERNGYDVFTRRASVPARRRLFVFGRAWVAAQRHRFLG